MLVIWFVLALAADLVIWFVWKPHLPPGDMSSSAQHQQFDIAVLAITGAPVVIAVLLYFIYSIVVWRARPGDDSDGPPIYGNTKVQATWIIGTSAIVLWLAVFGTVELIGPAGAGAGEGPQPIWTLAGKQSATWTPGTNTMLQVQVIGQQWAWTYRYPQFGGMESTVLYLPFDTPVTFHVTSLDVIHSFWAYKLGVKADANPGVDNVAYTTAKAHRRLRGPLQRAVRHLARRHDHLRAGRLPDRVPVLGQRRAVPGAGERDTRRPAAVRAGLRPHRDPAARQGDRQRRRHHRRRRLLLRPREPGDAMTRFRPPAAAHLKSTTTSVKG